MYTSGRLLDFFSFFFQSRREQHPFCTTRHSDDDDDDGDENSDDDDDDESDDDENNNKNNNNRRFLARAKPRVSLRVVSRARRTDDFAGERRTTLDATLLERYENNSAREWL